MTSKTVSNSLLVTVGSTFGASIVPQRYGGKGELPTVKMMIGTGVTYVGLSILDDMAPAVARPLAVVLAVTALMYYGAPILTNYFNPATPQRSNPR